MTGEATREAQVVSPAQVGVSRRQDDVVVEGDARQDNPPLGGEDGRVTKERDVVVGVRHS
jgi:hypothetical protein